MQVIKLEEAWQNQVLLVYWKDSEVWLGDLEEYPVYLTQRETLEELKENLKDIHHDLSSGSIPGVRQVYELEVAW